MKVLVRPLAAVDVDDAFQWYEAQAAGLGAEFLRATAAVLELVGRHPEMFPEVHGGRRRALVRRFPYAIYYRLVQDQALVVACLHLRRDQDAAATRA